jgi:DNA modification methylase
VTGSTNGNGAKFSGGLADGLVALRAAQKAGEPEPAYRGQEATGTSIFDPVLCEVCYRWFCPPGGAVLDPFCGGSVRGVVAALLGRRYCGFDLRPEQVEANQAQGAALCPAACMPEWFCGDSRETLPALAAAGTAFDFVFSCPPYGDLERYSDDPRDLSTMDYPAFRAAYTEVVAAACRLLRPDRFAAFVVGDFRDRKGFYRSFPAHTVAAFEAAGLRYYNEAVLLTAVGSLPIRVGKQFEGARKLGRTHQQVLVFVKGCPKAATAAVGPVDFWKEGAVFATAAQPPVAGDGVVPG